MFDVHGETVGRLGILKLNKEHRYNTLSPSFAHEVSRGIGSFYEDRLTRAIYVAPQEGQQWCNGTDFRTLLGMKKEQNYERVADYLQQLYQLQTQVAKTNKPIIAAAPGHAFNSGATLLATCGYPLMTTDSKMAFNECTFGFVPHSGATYYLSRLPNEFGTFLALTGMSIHGTDAVKLNLVDSMLQTTTYVEDDVADTVYSMGYNPREFHESDTHHAQRLLQDKERKTARLNAILTRQERNHELDNKAYYQAQLWSGRDRLDRPRAFEDASERAPSSVGDADAMYNQMLRDEQAKYQHEGTPYLEQHKRDPTDFNYQRIYQPTLDYIKSHVGHQYEADRTVAVQHTEMIARCFYPSSVEEIMQNLHQEGSPFALTCLEAMKRNSKLSMRLALQMLRKATNLDYVSCLNMEVKVASKMIETKDFDIGVQQVLLSPKKQQGQKVPNAAKYKKIDNNSSLDEYFEGASWAQNVNVGAMEHALLPTRHYYERFGDQVRLWINEESTHQDELRPFFDQEAKEALHQIGIDVRDKGLTMQSAREHLAAKLAQERREAVQLERMQQIMTDKQLRSIYFHRVDKELTKLRRMDKKEFQKKIDDCIQNVFERAYTQRLQTMFDKSREAQSLERRRMLIRLKRFLFRSRCTTDGALSHKKQLQRLENYSFKLPHLSESWDKSWRDFNHPLIEKSPLYHLSKAIGKVTYSPVELTREYLTNPQAREKLSMLTVDKEELKRIQDDIFANPGKYQAMFTKREPTDWGLNRHLFNPVRNVNDQRLTDHIFWHNMLNDGTEKGMENWPLQHEYTTYKHWFDQVEDRALGTLKTAVAKLLADFDDPSVKTFDGSNLTKRGQIETLMANIEGQERAQTEEKQQRLERKARKLTSSKRDIDTVSQLLDDVMNEDPHLKALLSPSESIDHPLVSNIQNQARDQLMRMLEIVLLDKYSQELDAEDKQMLKRRLGQLMTPEGMDKEELYHQQLKLIDSYLVTESGKSTLKSALNLIKPAYLGYLDSLLTEQATALCQELSVNETGNYILVHYHMLKTNPNLDRSVVSQRIQNYSKKEENERLFFETMPTMSPTFKTRQLMNELATKESTYYLAKTPIDEQKKKVEEEMQAQETAISQLETNLKAMSDEYAKAAADHNTASIDNPDDDVRNLEVFWSEAERNQLAQEDIIFNKSVNWLLEHKYEIDNHFTPLDWLKIYSEAIQEQGLDMNVALKFLSSHESQDDQLVDQQRSQEEWEQLGALANYMSGVRDSLARYKPEQMPDFAQQETANSTESQSLWELALSKKQQYVQDRAAAKRANRSEIIRQQLADFNQVQELAETRVEQVAKLESLAQRQPAKVRDLINTAISTPSTCLDFDKLYKSIVKGGDPTKTGLSEFVNVDLLMRNLREAKSSEALSSRILSTNTDVQSLFEAKEQAEKDSSLTLLEKAQILRLIDHCQTQMQFVSDSQRQQISMSQYLTQYDLSSSGSLVSQSTGMLKRKIASALGEDSASGSIVDWEVNGVRTSPLDHTQDSEPSARLSSIAQGTEKAQPDDEIVEMIDLETGISDKRSVRDHVQLQVSREAKQLTRLTEDMDQYKNFYENELLKALMIPDAAKANEAQQRVIDEYTSLRLKTCMLNATFAAKVRDSEDGHLYLKVLREKVLDELKLTQEPELEDFQFKAMYEKGADMMHYDVEAAYNMQDVSNTQAIGFDNLAKKAGATDDSRSFESAHESVFDKMLADYYLSQRGEYAEANKLMKQLTEVFDKQQLEKKELRDTLTGRSLHNYKLEQDLEKENHAYILPRQAKNIIDLDVLTHQAIQNGKSGLSEDLRALSITDTEHPQHWTTQVPEHFDLMDVRLKPETYIQNKLQQVVDEAFEARRKLERNMSRRELIAFDKVLAKYLEPKNLMKRLSASVEEDYSAVFQGRQVAEHNKNQESTQEFDIVSEPNMQRKFNKSIKDEDAIYKGLAMSTMMEVKIKEQMENPDYVDYKDKEAMVNPFTFERFYLNQLNRDSLNEPRPINPADFEPKKIDPTAPKEYLTPRQREEQFHADYKLFTENKKEQQDRTALFYILEQFFEQSRQNPDKMSQAQDHMREYFSDPDNTFFFDKNKIQ